LVASITCANVKTFWLFCGLSNLFSLHKLDVQGDGHLATGENAAGFEIDCSGHLVKLATSQCKPSTKEREALFIANTPGEGRLRTALKSRAIEQAMPKVSR